MTTFGDTWEWDSTRKSGPNSSRRASPGRLSGPRHGDRHDPKQDPALWRHASSSHKTGRGRRAPTAIRFSNEGLGVGWRHDDLDQSDAPATTSVPAGRQYPIMAYDEGRQKLFLYDGLGYGSTMSSFWEWDPISAGWTPATPGTISATDTTITLPTIPSAGAKSFSRILRTFQRVAHCKPGSSMPRAQPGTCEPWPLRRGRATAPPWPSTRHAVWWFFSVAKA
jgi:hypothetical protein